MAKRGTGKEGKPKKAGFRMALRDSLVKQFGAAEVPTVEDFTEARGLPLLNNLPLQYVLGTDVLVLGRCINVIGPWMSGKTQFAWYIAKLFMEFPGFIFWIETESKPSREQIKAILQKDMEVIERFVIANPTKTIENVLQKLQICASEFSKVKPEKGEKKLPLLIMIDSLAGVTSVENVEAMEKDGVAGVGFGAARVASAITEQMKAFVPKYLADNPILLLTTNHEKTKIPEPGSFSRGGPGRTTGSGGDHKDFAATWTLRMVKGNRETRKTSATSTFFWITAVKNQMGMDGNKLVVPVYTYVRDNQKVIEYDWDYSLVNLLGIDGPFAQDAVKEIIDFQRTGLKCTSTTLGVKDPIHPTELGKMIHADETIARNLQNLMGITICDKV